MSKKIFVVELIQLIAKISSKAPDGIDRDEWPSILNELADVVGVTGVKYVEDYAAAFQTGAVIIDDIAGIIEDESQEYLGWRICEMIESGAGALKRQFPQPATEPIE